MKKIIYFSYFLLLVFFSFFSYLFIDPNLVYLKNLYTGFVFENREVTTLLYIVLVMAFFLGYSQILKNIRMIDISSLKLLIGLTALILVFSYPAFLSFDIFNYIATAKTLFFYGENPYLVMPIEFAGDPLLLFTHAANKIALYGPLWIGLTSIPYFLSFGHFLTILFSLKVFIALFYLGTIYTLWKITKNVFSIVFFAFNPLVVVETLMSYHNDIVMMFFALVSFYFLSKRKIFLAMSFLIVSILIKYATIFLIPVFIYVLIKIVKREKNYWDNIYLISAILMFTIFLLSSLRVEIYSWYGIWFLSFLSLVQKRKTILYGSLALSLGLLLRYIPFMFFGIYDSSTAILREAVTFFPPIFLYLLIILRKFVWAKNT
ncbi:hypothetical protein A3F29_00440 [Candidatus Roizmanbacteria bacterium RIFCSPHIGHO2_12_FULL_33_9]|uniref:Glycosyltransferase RgtA/B/C/D-like domain-containing protein n=1 Tax=Candidatus Roizmanbacteria bacterium RIFCSPHIGHO2_12_FULL_33_9 TaxID=1802045 RepID=A0A1F7HGT8_9BACT|nr:MAG: hypothetical protein A3F29_00440 [Candidatus Roizmanbacteria bacterium RIFCSPHIGHO2_12_FULL_33_9]